jgi:ABC-2 type transport system permease protein
MIELSRGAWVVTHLEVLRFVRDRSRLISSLGFPLLFLAIFGVGFKNVVGQMGRGIDLIDFMYPGIVAMAAQMTALVAGISVVQDREAGFLKEILVAPLSRTGIVLGKAFGVAAVAVLQVLMLIAVAPIVGVGVDFDLVLRLLPSVVVLSLGLSGLGILIASFMRSQQGFQMLVNVLVFPMFFLAGVFFPVDGVPVWMEVLSKINPVTYGVDAIRQIFLGSDLAAAGLGVTVLGHSLGVGEEVALVGALGIVLVAGAVWAFGRQEQ